MTARRPTASTPVRPSASASHGMSTMTEAEQIAAGLTKGEEWLLQALTMQDRNRLRRILMGNADD